MKKGKIKTEKGKLNFASIGEFQTAKPGPGGREKILQFWPCAMVPMVLAVRAVPMVKLVKCFSKTIFAIISGLS